ncbi:hypothetical protein VTG60DRAFT_437 [Thermothelomyces hinnuleus]
MSTARPDLLQRRPGRHHRQRVVPHHPALLGAPHHPHPPGRVPGWVRPAVLGRRSRRPRRRRRQRSRVLLLLLHPQGGRVQQHRVRGRAGERALRGPPEGQPRNPDGADGGRRRPLGQEHAWPSRRRQQDRPSPAGRQARRDRLQPARPVGRRLGCAGEVMQVFFFFFFLLLPCQIFKGEGGGLGVERKINYRLIKRSCTLLYSNGPTLDIIYPFSHAHAGMTEGACNLS